MDLALFLIFNLLVTFIFFKLVINVPVVLVVLNPTIVNSLPPLPIINLSRLKNSISPLSVVKIYLSSSYGKKNSSLSEIIVLVWFWEIFTLYCCLTTTSEPSEKSTDAIFLFGSLVKNELSSDLWSFDEYNLKSEGEISIDGKDPSHIPETVVTPTITALFCVDEITFEKVILSDCGFVYPTILLGFNILSKGIVLEVTVLTPDDDALIVTSPILNIGICLISALK